MLYDPLSLPVGSFLTVLVQLEDAEVKDLMEKELSGRNRPRYIAAIKTRLGMDDPNKPGVTGFKEEVGEELVIEGGNAFIVKDGKKEPYTSSVLPDTGFIDSPERKKRAMELL